MRITFERSEAMFERGLSLGSSADEHTRTIECAEFVQLTYETLRLGPDGETVACYDGEYWRIEGDDSLWSDVVISS